MKIKVLLTMMSFGWLSMQSMSGINTDSDSLNTDSLTKKVVFGFQVGMNYSSFYDTQSPNKGNKITAGRGVRLGIQMNNKLNDYFSLSTKGELMFNDSKFLVTDDDNIVYESTLLPVSLQFMTHLEICYPGKKWQPYLLFGPNLRLPVKSENISQRVYGSKTDVAADAGFGLNLVLKNMIISPEIRYSYGFSDINKSPFVRETYHHQFCFMLRFIG